MYCDLHFYVVLLVIMTNVGKILLLKMLILEILLLKMMDKVAETAENVIVGDVIAGNVAIQGQNALNVVANEVVPGHV